jgi:hypothetical protein
MLLTTGLALLGVWFVGVLGAFDAGSLVHVLLLVGLMLLLLAALKDRDAEAAAAGGTRR